MDQKLNELLDSITEGIQSIRVHVENGKELDDIATMLKELDETVWSLEYDLDTA